MIEFRTPRYCAMLDKQIIINELFRIKNNYNMNTVEELKELYRRSNNEIDLKDKEIQRLKTQINNLKCELTNYQQAYLDAKNMVKVFENEVFNLNSCCQA